MINELNEMIVGFDLCSDFSQMTFYNRNNTEPMTVSLVPGKEEYKIATPKDLFPLVEQKADLGVALLSNFFKQCFELLSSAGKRKDIRIMVTMERMKGEWPKAVPKALGMLDIPRDRVYLQDHLESFYFYVLSQKKELWNYQVAMLEYSRDRITGYEMSIDYKTKPSFVSVDRRFRLYLDEKSRAGRKEEEWNKVRDKILLEKVQGMFQNKSFSSVYLLGDEFEGTWAEKTLAFLCKRRHVFQGSNLFTKGACYGAMHHGGAVPIGSFLFRGKDMIEHNIGMQMNVRGAKAYYPLISAGINSYAAFHECEFILNHTDEIVLQSKSLEGKEMSHSVVMKNLPERPNRATRIRMQVTFPEKSKCQVYLDDLGLGDLYPSSGRKWETVIDLDEEGEKE